MLSGLSWITKTSVLTSTAKAHGIRRQDTGRVILCVAQSRCLIILTLRSRAWEGDCTRLTRDVEDLRRSLSSLEV